MWDTRNHVDYEGAYRAHFNTIPDLCSAGSKKVT